MSDGKPRRVILDTGPLVAFLDAKDKDHPWARQTFSAFAEPAHTCEAVVTETLFLLRRLRPAQEKVLEWLESRRLLCDFMLSAETAAVRVLWARYKNVPMSLADACIVRMAEMRPGTVICTLDSDFAIYRKNDRHPLVLLTPESR